MLIIPITHQHKLFGHSIEKTENTDSTFQTSRLLENGDLIINTTEIGKKYIGYAGTTPIEMEIKDNKIKSIKVLPNRETPEYLGAVLNSDMLDSILGKTPQEILNSNIDGVTGATFTSTAIIDNIRSGASYALQGATQGESTQNPSKQDRDLGLKFYITLIIILSGAILPFIFRSNRTFRFIQLGLNVIILGFWSGTFLCYSLMVSFFTNGFFRIVALPSILLLVTAFIYPMFGRSDHYCAWLCPYGSLQELAGKCSKKKIHLSASTVKFLNGFRVVLWFSLMWLLWTGLWFDWMGYEPFAAFFILDASPIVLGIAGIFLILSIFIPRPYCRFVCPTGTLFKLSEARK